MTLQPYLKNFKYFIFFILIIGISYNFYIANSLKYESYGDASDYLHLGLSLAKTHKYGHLKLKEEENLMESFKSGSIENNNYKFDSHSTWRPPIWPLLIAGTFLSFGYNLLYLLIFKFLLHIIGLYIFYKTLKLIKIKDEIIFVGLLLYGLSPAWQIYSRVFLSEPITLFVITLWVYLLVGLLKKRFSWWPQSIIAGILILCHPYFIFLPFSIWFFLLINAQIKFRITLYSVILCVLITSVWIVRNFIVLNTSEIVLTTSSGSVMAKGWNKKILKEHTNTRGDLANEALVLDTYVYDKTISYNEVQTMTLYKNATLSYINSNRNLILPIIIKKITSAINPFPELAKPGILETGRWIMQLLALLAIIYIIISMDNKLVKPLALGLLLSTVLITVITYSGFRFRMPQVGLELLFIIVALKHLSSLNKEIK